MMIIFYAHTLRLNTWEGLKGLEVKMNFLSRKLYLLKGDGNLNQNDKQN